MKHDISKERIRPLNDFDSAKGKYVFYWMQQSQRADWNHALEYAIANANHLKLPLLVGFGLMDDYPEANVRHYRFLLEGLKEAESALKKRKIPFTVQHGHPAEVAIDLGKQAAVLVCDRGYLRHQKQWREKVAAEAKCPVVQVESDVVVPVELTSTKAEFAARTIRPKIHKHWKTFLDEVKPIKLKIDSEHLKMSGLDVQDTDKTLAGLKLNRDIPPVNHIYRGGCEQAKRVFGQFLKHHFADYSEHRNKPETDSVSYLSMYLHFGQISPIYAALESMKVKNVAQENHDDFLEELIVRRELSMNFVEYSANYHEYECLPDWARTTLAEHKKDKREPQYSKKQLEEANTHDDYWNAAMREMKYTGYMHNAMRMYWGKKILEWMSSPELAFDTVLEFNNRYFIDGRDANSFAGVAWIFGLHDRPWKERDIFGKTRYMNASGLERKCKIDMYVEKVDALVNDAEKHGVCF